MNKSETIGKLAEALAKAQGEIEGAKKDTVNPFYNKKYADLSSVWDACREPLSKHGLSICQVVTSLDDGTPVITTVLMHTSGEWISGEIKMRPVRYTKEGEEEYRGDPQSIGIAITYARRYGLSAMVGIAPEDDDANGIYGNKETTKPTEPSRKSQPPPRVENPLLATTSQLNTIKALFQKLGIEPDTAFLQAAMKLETKPHYFQDVTKEVAAGFIKHLQELDTEVVK